MRKNKIITIKNLKIMTQQTSNSLQIINNTKPAAIAELEFVKKKFIANYNFCHKDKQGEMMYHRQLVHFKQAIEATDALKACDPFSLYACFVTAAVNGYSFDPQDSEVYLIPLKGKAYLWRQAGAHVRRLMRTGQTKGAEQAKLVYQGDEFIVENGKVVRHVEKFTSETIFAGYVKFIIDGNGGDRFFIYRKSDWEAWKKKSQQPNGDNWTGNNGQPGAAFLRTKIVKHACQEKCWAVGTTVPQAEQFSVEVDGDSKDEVENPPVDATHTDVTDDNGSNTVPGSFAAADNKSEPATIVHAGNDEDDAAY